jgi:thiol-disulfide isomerase/thioredoxin
MTPRQLKVMICTLLLLLVTPANAQDQDPNAILDAAKAAIEELDGFSAQFKMRGEGGSMFADTMPSMNGQLFFGTHETYGRVIHIIGEIREQKSAPAKPLEILLASDRYIWADNDKRTINEYPSSGSTRGLPTAFNLTLLSSLTQGDPFDKDMNNAQTIDLLAQATINSVLCDVVHIKRAKPSSNRRQSSNDSYTDARWYIGVKDKLPRKVEHITDAGLIKITLVFELSNLKTAALTQTQLDIPRPDGYQFISKLPKPKPETPEEPTPAPGSQTNSAQPTGDPVSTDPMTPRVRLAPSFSFTPEGSEVDSAITNATQAGRITVLYFWGSWCVPCKATSPMVSELAPSLSTNGSRSMVDVFGLAVREADPARTRSNFESEGFTHALVLDADQIATDFGVRVFPSIVVINGEGEIVFQERISKETTAEALVDGAKKAIIEAMTQETTDSSTE